MKKNKNKRTLSVSSKVHIKWQFLHNFLFCSIIFHCLQNETKRRENKIHKIFIKHHNKRKNVQQKKKTNAMLFMNCFIDLTVIKI